MMDPEKIAKLRIAEKDQIAPKARRKSKLLVVILLLFGAATLLALLYAQGFLTPAATVSVTSVTWVYPSQTITEFNSSGYVVAQRRAAVASKGTGRLDYIGVEEGSRVKSGEVLARLENDDLRAERAQTAAQLAAARAELTSAETERLTAGRNWKRMEDLWKRRFVSQVDTEAAEDRYLKAKASVQSAAANITALEAALERLSVLIEYTIIRAPFDGVVLTKDAEMGEVVAPFGSATNAKAAVVTMADLSSLVVEADVSESFLPKVRVDQPCEIQLDALPNTRFPGSVRTIVPTADRTRGTVLVKVAFDRLDPRILPEMSARVSFLSRTLSEEEAHPFLAVHHDALTQRDGAQGIFKIEDERARWIPVPSAERMGDYLLLGSLLQAGEQVVLKPSPALKAGERIKVAE